MGDGRASRRSLKLGVDGRLGSSARGRLEAGLGAGGRTSRRKSAYGSISRGCQAQSSWMAIPGERLRLLTGGRPTALPHFQNAIASCQLFHRIRPTTKPAVRIVLATRYHPAVCLYIAGVQEGRSRVRFGLNFPDVTTRRRAAQTPCILAVLRCDGGTACRRSFLSKDGHQQQQRYAYNHPKVNGL